MPDRPILALAVLLALATLVQSAVGFGSMLIVATVGALFLPMPELLGLVVPVSVAQNLAILSRHHREVDRSLLLGSVLPWMGAGTLAGLAASAFVRPAALRPALGVFVLGMAFRELLRDGPGPPPRPAVARIALAAAGVVHGLFATGGPLLVWALGRQRLDKRAFRSTLTAVWFALNVVLVAAYVARGQIDAHSAARSAWLVAPVLLGVALGERVHDRVDERAFRRAVWGALAVAALALVLS